MAGIYDLSYFQCSDETIKLANPTTSNQHHRQYQSSSSSSSPPPPPTYSSSTSSSSLFEPYLRDLRRFVEDIIEDVEQEDINDYKQGGYHPISMFDVLNGQYSAICKLGWGHFSTVWLCWDLKNNRYVAIKVVKSSLHYSETAMDEIIILKKIRTAEIELNIDSGIVQLLDDFIITGINGNHVCMVFEVLGSNLLDLIVKSNYTGIPLENVRCIIKQVLEGLDFMHRLTIIHTDIKPENILMDEGDLKVQTLAFKALYRTHMGFALPSIYTSNAPLKQFEQEQKRKNQARRKKIKRKKYLYNHKRKGAGGEDTTLPDFNRIFDEKQDWVCFEGKFYPPYVIDILTKGPELMQLVKSQNPLDPCRDLCDVRVKIGDLGNACYEANHFCDNIQTRQYRAPEVILNLGYCHTADIWSVGCMAFELATGEYLFDPRKGSTYSRDEDHLARMIELLGPFPRLVVNEGARYLEFFHRNGSFRGELYTPYNIFSMLHLRLKWPESIAAIFSHFLEMTLDYLPLIRSKAYDCLQHPFIKKHFNYYFFMKELWGPQLEFSSESETDNEDDEGEENEIDGDLDSKSVSSYSSCGKNTDQLEDYAHYPVKYTDSVEYLTSFDLVKACCPSKIIPSLLEMLEFYRIYFAGRPMRKSIDLTITSVNRRNSKNVHLLDFEGDCNQTEEGVNISDEIEELCDRLFQVIYLKYNSPSEEAVTAEEVVETPSGEAYDYKSNGESETLVDDNAEVHAFERDSRCLSCGCGDEVSHYDCLD